jgi:5'-3' exonuclease
MRTALVVDGNNLAMRALFAAQHTGMSSQGVWTGPLVIFVNSLAKHVRDERPTRLLVVWDGGVSVARQKMLPGYKAHRVPGPEAERRHDVFELITEFCSLAGVSGLRLSGYEADDLIAGAWASLTSEEADKIVILSSDKDFLQLLGPNPHGVETELVRLSSSGTPTDRWTAIRVVEERGYAPEEWPLVTALAGDTSDGVPGLRGIGPKRAVKLLEAAGWSLESLQAELSAEQAALARTCFDVVNLRDTHMAISVPTWRPTQPGALAWPILIDFLSTYDMIVIKDRLLAGELWSDRSAMATVSDEDRTVRCDDDEAR